MDDIEYIIRSATEKDARYLSILRLQIDGETEYLDRESGEAYLNEDNLCEIIKCDTEKKTNLFLVAVVDEEIVGFSRCEGSSLTRAAHKVEFGVCVRKAYWGYGIGKSLLKKSVEWADACGIMKISLHVLETNVKAVKLYEKHGFEVEGVLKRDKKLSDGNYYNTVVMGRLSN
jgi:ribosomal protein S18 acetylase RimI-like enzyme